MKKIKLFLKILLALVILFLSFYFFVHRGNNRVAIWYHHGLWLPNSVKNINFYTHPQLISVDDWAKTELEIPKTELGNILKGQQYQYLVSIDSSESGLCWSYNMSGYRAIPDSIINGPLPITIELKSFTGDFLMFYAEEKTQEILYVHLYTDWN